MTPKEKRENTKKILFFFYGIVAAIIPYIARLSEYYFNSNELPGFYQSELDLFVFCIAICIALFADTNAISKSSGTNSTVYFISYAIFLCFMGICLQSSLGNEVDKIILEQRYISCLKNSLPTDQIIDEITKCEDKKFKLFLVSILFSLVCLIACYSMVFSKKAK